MTPTRPSMRTVPSLALSSPARVRRTVDLPTPFAPTSTDALAVPHPKRDVVEQAMSAAGALPRQALHFDRAHGEATLRGRRIAAAD